MQRLMHRLMRQVGDRLGQIIARQPTGVVSTAWSARGQAACRDAAALALLTTLACSQVSQPPRELDLDPPEPVSMQELAATHVSLDREANTHGAVVQLKACITIVNRLSAPLQQLLPLLNGPRKLDSLPFQLAALTPSHCSGPAYANTMALIDAALSRTPQKVGLILPLGGEHSAFAQALVKGARAAATRLQHDFSSNFVIKDSAGSAQGALTALAELVFYDEAALVVGGLKTDEAQALLPLASGLAMPMLIVNKNHALIKEEPQAFQVYPNEHDLALTLAHAAQQRNFRRIAVLKPAGGRNDALVSAFREALQAAGLSVSADLTYTPGDYTSMNQAVASIAQTEAESRRGEYLQLLKEGKKRAADERQAFDPRSVVLPPRLECDAVFIPDHYRNIRFFVKLFKYHGITKLPLIGNHHWRSRELLQPWDSFLEGALFADFIGSYQEVPRELAVKPAADSEFFVPASDVADVDFQLLGYRTASIALKLLHTPYLKTKQLTTKLEKLVEDDRFFAHEPTFGADRAVHWPTFVFHVSKEKLQLQGRYSGGQQATVPSAPH